ncbi:hypothetical protein [Holospora elegans]|nr:hypothetical protein [Holospora elegans]
MMFNLFNLVLLACLYTGVVYSVKGEYSEKNLSSSTPSVQKENDSTQDTLKIIKGIKSKIEKIKKQIEQSNKKKEKNNF